MQEKQYIALPIDDANGMLNYFANQPYIQVAKFVDQLRMAQLGTPLPQAMPAPNVIETPEPATAGGTEG